MRDISTSTNCAHAVIKGRAVKKLFETVICPHSAGETQNNSSKFSRLVDIQNTECLIKRSGLYLRVPISYVYNHIYYIHIIYSICLQNMLYHVYIYCVVYHILHTTYVKLYIYHISNIKYHKLYDLYVYILYINTCSYYMVYIYILFDINSL